MPALANAHDHARPIPLSSFGLGFLPLESWLPLSLISAPPDPYLSAAVAFGKTARSGCAATMVHYTRPSGRMDPIAEAAEVARAARDIGIRIAFAPALRDRNPLSYGDDAAALKALSAPAARMVQETYFKPPQSPRAMVDLTDEIAQAIGSDLVSVQYGPAGVQWCSDALLELIAERSALNGRRVHMHVLETIHQRDWADRTYPEGIIAHLDRIGLLSPRLCLVHCVHARPDEIALLAERGVTVVNCPSSNFHLRSGLAPVPEICGCGCGLAVGMDGQTLDEDQDMLRELRLAHAVHGGLGYRRTWQPDAFLAATLAASRRVCDAPGGGAIGPGEPADLLVLDYDRIDCDRLLPVAPADLLLARASASAVSDLVVDGREVVTDGHLAGFDLLAAEEELRGLFRVELARQPDFLATLTALRHALPDAYRDLAGCGF